MIEVILLVFGTALGAGGYFGVTEYRKNQDKTKAKDLVADAKNKASNIVLKAKDEAVKIIDDAKKEANDRRKETKKIEDRLSEREVTLDKKFEELDKRAEKMRKSESELDDIKDEVREIKQKQVDKLEKIAKLTKAEAQEKLLQTTEKRVKTDLLELVNKLQHDAMDEAEEKAQLILLTAMERMSSDVTADRTVTSLKLPDDEMKGRIIGKEGRNIQALQRATGVDILVDDTPGMIVLSSFAPVRRQVARLALENLMKDGRIHPARIEEVVEKAEKEISKEVMRAGEDAAREVGVLGLPKELLRLVGELKYRTSYGQNVLKHSTEMAHIAGLIAEEIGADVKTVKTAALLHDMGKAGRKTPSHWCRTCS